MGITMKKFIPIIIICILLLSGLGVIAQPETENTSEKVTLRFSQPTFTNENEYISITLNEANSFLMEQGKPMLPSYAETFTFPIWNKN